MLLFQWEIKKSHTETQFLLSCKVKSYITVTVTYESFACHHSVMQTFMLPSYSLHSNSNKKFLNTCRQRCWSLDVYLFFLAGKEHRGNLSLSFFTLSFFFFPSLFCAYTLWGLYPMETTHCRLAQKQMLKKKKEKDWQVPRCSPGIVLRGQSSPTHPLSLSQTGSKSRTTSFFYFQDWQHTNSDRHLFSFNVFNKYYIHWALSGIVSYVSFFSLRG